MEVPISEKIIVKEFYVWNGFNYMDFRDTFSKGEVPVNVIVDGPLVDHYKKVFLDKIKIDKEILDLGDRVDYEYEANKKGKRLAGTLKYVIVKAGNSAG